MVVQKGPRQKTNAGNKHRPTAQIKGKTWDTGRKKGELGEVLGWSPSLVDHVRPRGKGSRKRLTPKGNWPQRKINAEKARFRNYRGEDLDVKDRLMGKLTKRKEKKLKINKELGIGRCGKSTLKTVKKKNDPRRTKTFYSQSKILRKRG